MKVAGEMPISISPLATSCNSVAVSFTILVLCLHLGRNSQPLKDDQGDVAGRATTFRIADADRIDAQKRLPELVVRSNGGPLGAFLDRNADRDVGNPNPDIRG